MPKKKKKNKVVKPDRCQFAEGKENHCDKKATRKWGDHWFCEYHGRR